MNPGTTNFTPGHLFTWVDIDDYFKRLAIGDAWPSWLLEVNAYWDSVEFIVRGGTNIEGAWTWLEEHLGPLSVSRGQEAIILESTGELERILPVQFEESDNLREFDRKPRWNERRVVSEIAIPLPAPQQPEFRDNVQICAFHSFKGGVGRTLHCVALAHELSSQRASRKNRKRTLLVDADLEAPGISWMVSTQGGRLDFSLEDFYTLLHGTTTEDYPSAIQLARKFLVNQEYDDIVVLPARRNTSRVGPPIIEPVDLLSSDRPAYFVSEAIADLAIAVDADIALVDLRAGTSELNAPVLLDPRVQRVFVTTLSDQSVRGTIHLLEDLARRAPAQRSSDPFARIILTQFNEKNHEHVAGQAAASLSDALSRLAHVTSTDEADTSASVVDQDIASQLLTSPFNPQLLALPATWDAVRDTLQEARVAQRLVQLTDQLTSGLISAPNKTALGTDFGSARERLHRTAQPLIYAETAEGGDDLLPTDALTNLVAKHRTEPPIEIVVGAKGSGKTFTYLRMCKQGTWSKFARLTSVDAVEVEAPLVPVLGSQNLPDNVREQLEDIQTASAGTLGGGEPASFLRIRDLITTALASDMNDVEWRRLWLVCLAHAAGFPEVTSESVEGVLTEIARRSRAVFVLDGLEDLFQKFNSDSREQQALRVLLTGCPEWLRSLRGHPLGLIVFVRRDLVISAIYQNTDQFLSRYRAYELRWNRTEALRLAAWICQKSGILQGPDVTITDATQHDLSALLVQLWGQKLGADKSREARSEEWFIAALSDFNQQIQARDIVSFLSESARVAIDDGRITARWEDRILPPTAMRRALPVCSRDKIEALSQENRPVGDVLKHLANLPEEKRKVPFTLESVQLDSVNAELLEANGVLFREESQYWIPEIYRHGLNFGLSGTGRPRVLAVAKLVRRRNDI